MHELTGLLLGSNCPLRHLIPSSHTKVPPFLFPSLSDCMSCTGQRKDRAEDQIQSKLSKATTGKTIEGGRKFITNSLRPTKRTNCLMNVFISDKDTAKLHVQFLDKNNNKRSVQFH